MDYEINQDTLAIIPKSYNSSKILEIDNEYDIDLNPYSVMEHSCEYFGSSLEGRINGSKNMLGSIYKSPVLVEESRNIIFFPTKSPNLESNVWISLNNIDHYEKCENNTKIYFKNNKELVIDIPILSFENQVLRATKLESVFRKRKFNKKDDLY